MDLVWEQRTASGKVNLCKSCSFVSKALKPVVTNEYTSWILIKQASQKQLKHSLICPPAVLITTHRQIKIVCSFQECFNHLFYTIWVCSSFSSLWSRFEHYIASLRLSEHNMADARGRSVCWSEGVPVWGHTVSMKTYEASRQTDKTAFWIICFRDRFHGCLSGVLQVLRGLSSRLACCFSDSHWHLTVSTAEAVISKIIEQDWHWALWQMYSCSAALLNNSVSWTLVRLTNNQYCSIFTWKPMGVNKVMCQQVTFVNNLC